MTPKPPATKPTPITPARLQRLAAVDPELVALLGDYCDQRLIHIGRERKSLLAHRARLPAAPDTGNSEQTPEDHRAARGERVTTLAIAIYAPPAERLRTSTEPTRHERTEMPPAREGAGGAQSTGRT